MPGVGQKFELETDDGERLVVVLHHDGKREVFRRPTPEADSEKLFALSDTDARQFAAILEGAYFQPLDLDSLEVPLGGAIIEWVELDADSPFVGDDVGSLDLRERTGATVVAVQRDTETIPSPDSDCTLRTGDILVAVGSREEQRALRDLATASE